jgi:hypothetical protein
MTGYGDEQWREHLLTHGRQDGDPKYFQLKFAVYYSLNARLTEFNHTFAADAIDVSHRTLIPFDLDHCSPDQAMPIYDYLCQRFPTETYTFSNSVFLIDSGNGSHILIAIDAYAVQDVAGFIRSLYREVMAAFPTFKINNAVGLSLDGKVLDTPRILRLPGTTNNRNGHPFKHCRVIRQPWCIQSASIPDISKAVHIPWTEESPLIPAKRKGFKKHEGLWKSQFPAIWRYCEWFSQLYVGCKIDRFEQTLNQFNQPQWKRKYMAEFQVKHLLDGYNDGGDRHDWFDIQHRHRETYCHDYLKDYHVHCRSVMLTASKRVNMWYRFDHLRWNPSEYFTGREDIPIEERLTNMVILKTEDLDKAKLMTRFEWFEGTCRDDEVGSDDEDRKDSKDGGEYFCYWGFGWITRDEMKDVLRKAAGLPDGIELINQYSEDPRVLIPLPMGTKLGCNDPRTFYRYLGKGARLKPSSVYLNNMQQFLDSVKVDTIGNLFHVLGSSRIVDKAEIKRIIVSAIEQATHTTGYKHRLYNNLALMPLVRLGIDKQGVRTRIIL